MGIERYVHGARVVARAAMPRRRREARTAFVLSGGGVLGAVQVGQLVALLESGIVPDVLVAASVGALNAATIAADPTPQSTHRLREAWSHLRSEDIFPGSRMQRALHFVRKGDHLYPNTGMRRLIDMIPVRSFEGMERPLHVVAANLRTGKEHWFDSGLIAPAILASTAIPGVFPPVLVDGEVYVDGGVVNNVPLSRAVELGATKIYVLTCGAPRPHARPIRRPLDVFLQAVVHSRAARVERDLERFALAAEIDLLPVPETSAIRFNDPSQSAVLIENARAATLRHLEAVRTAAAL